jgi:uncharacterized membrane protein YfcA
MTEVLLAVPLAFLVGISLGMLGGGGSILAVPILVYVLRLDPKSAIATALVVVGITSLVGALRHHRRQNLNVRVGLSFGAAGIVGAYLGSRVATLEAVPGSALLVAFAVLMVIVAGLMLRDRPKTESRRDHRPPLPAVGGLGLVTGLLTGVLGVGGGFVIVPALILGAQLPVRIAIGTSLLIISLNCFAGALGYLSAVEIRWAIALAFTMASVMGSVVGANLASRTRPDRLRRGFAVFVLIVGTAMLVERGAQLL